MDAAYEIAQYLDDSGFGTIGTDIFVDQIPADTNGIFVETIGGQDGKYLPINEIIIAINTKDTRASDAKSTLNDIKNHINRMHNTSTANAYFYSMLVIGDIENISRDLEYGAIYKITVQCLVRDLGLIS